MHSRKVRRVLSLEVIHEDETLTIRQGAQENKLKRNLSLEDPIYNDFLESYDTETFRAKGRATETDDLTTNDAEEPLNADPYLETDSFSTSIQDISWQNKQFLSRSQILRKGLEDLQTLLEGCNKRLDNMVQENTPMKRQYGSSLALHKINDLSQGNVTKSLRKMFEQPASPQSTSTLPSRGRTHRRLERTSSSGEHADMRRCNSVYKLAPSSSYEAPEIRRSTSMVSMYPPAELQTIPEVPTSRIPVKVPPQTMPKPNRSPVSETRYEANCNNGKEVPRDCLLRDIRSFGASKPPQEKKPVAIVETIQLKETKQTKVMVDKETQTLVDKETQTTELTTEMATASSAAEPPCEKLSFHQISQVFNGTPKPVKQETPQRKVVRSPSPVTPEPKPHDEVPTSPLTEEELPRKDTVKNARSVFENGTQAQPLVFDVYSTLKRTAKAASPQFNPIARSQSTEPSRQSIARTNSAPVNSVGYKTPIHWPTFRETNQLVDKTARTSWKAVSTGHQRSPSSDLDSFCSEEISDGISDIDSELSHDSFYERNDTDYRYIPQDVLERIRSYGMTMTFFGGKVTIDDHCTDDDDDADNFSLIEEEISKKPVSRTNSAQSPRIIGCIPKESEKERKRHSSGESASSGVSSGHGSSNRDSPTHSPFTSLKRNFKEEKGKKKSGQSVVFNLKKSFVI